MKRYTMFVALLAFASTLAWSAEDGAALYKAKCAMCHGPAGEGKGISDQGPLCRYVCKFAVCIAALVLPEVTFLPGGTPP
jgi:hypothetical protein